MKLAVYICFVIPSWFH